MKDFNFELLDISSPVARQEYEIAFYQSFAKVGANRLMQKLWLWDADLGRIKTRVPYGAQLICALRDRCGKLHSAMAFNVALRQFQASTYGFAAPEQHAGVFEVLTFFATAVETLHVRASFWTRCVALLSACGFKTGYATTARRPLPMYQRAGWEVLEEREIEAEKRYFLQYKVSGPESRQDAGRGIHGLLMHAHNSWGQAANTMR